jgi:hypothetical protein
LAQEQEHGRATGSRFEIVVRQGPPHGDLFELEQTTYYEVVDRRTQEVIVTFVSEMEAGLSRSSGLWDDYRFSGVAQVDITPGEEALLVTYHDGRQETIALPPGDGSA